MYWCTNYALNTCPCFTLIFPQLGYIDTTRTHQSTMIGNVDTLRKHDPLLPFKKIYLFRYRSLTGPVGFIRISSATDHVP
jgi:hypothetical protein